jgi:hypothetical protein
LNHTLLYESNSFEIPTIAINKNMQLNDINFYPFHYLSLWYNL